MGRKLTGFLLGSALFAVIVVPGRADAQFIVSPVDAAINAGGPGFGLISHTFDQSGLSHNYVSGVTNFDAYMALNPLHTWIYPGNEWFSNSGTSSAVVTYDLGSVMSIWRLALWNEEVSGIGTLDLWGSVNGLDFFSLALGLAPTDNPADQHYAADVFTWSAVDLRYVRFDMSNCPQPGVGTFHACAIGEVAFGTAAAVAVPEPLSLILVLSGLAGAGLVGRRRKAA
jgi:hypothetical protein